VIPYTHPLALWTLGLQQRDFISCAMEKADLIIAVGYDLVEYSPNDGTPMATADFAHQHDPAEIDSSYIPRVEVIGDISDSLQEILKRVKRQGRPEPD
jgi:acetolactate synthase-1/2/3 large subunit